MKKVCVLGLGYIGLPTAVILAGNNFHVIGVDTNKKVIEKVSRGLMHIKEPGLTKDLKNALDRGNIEFSDMPETADIFIIAVPTPIKENRSCDLKYVVAAARSIVPCVKKGDLVVIESTIPPGVTDDIIRPIIESSGLKIGVDFFLTHCPERVLPGNILKEIIENNRVVGGCTGQCTEKASMFYGSFIKGKILKTDARTAEMTKLVENTFRDVNIALANELARICISLDINVFDVIRIANEHPRVSILRPGPGVGGHCLAVDPYFIIEKAPGVTKLISTAREINMCMPDYVVEKTKQLLKGINQPRVAVFGVAYKGDIDDIRESPALKIIKLLQNEEYDIAVYDPYVKSIGNIQLSPPEKAVEKADMLLILCDHTQFKELDYPLLVKKMRTPVFFDTRGILTDVEIPDRVFFVNYGNLQ